LMGSDTLDLLGCSVEKIAEHGDKCAAIIADHRLQFGVNFLALLLIKHRTSFEQLGIEISSLPMCIVLRCIGSISDRQGLIGGWTTTAIRHAKRCFHPDIIPISIGWLALNVDLNARFGCGGAENCRCIDSTCESGIGGRQLDFQRIHASLFEIKLGLFGIISTLRKREVEVRVGAWDRIVVAQTAITAQSSFEQLLSVDGVLDSKADIVVGKWRLRAIHQERKVLAARGLDDIEVWIALEQIDGLEVELVNGVNLTGHYGVGTRGHIIDDNNFYRIDPGCIRLPIALIARETCTHTGLKTLKDERSGADRLVEIRPALRNYEEVIIGQNVRQIGVAALQCDLYCSCIDLGNVGKFRGERTSARDGFATMQVDRIDDVIGVECLAVMEGYPLANFKGPFLGVG